MLSLTIKDTKNFMSQLLIKEAFDGAVFIRSRDKNSQFLYHQR